MCSHRRPRMSCEHIGAWRRREEREDVTIVLGYYKVDPQKRAEFLAARHERMRSSRADDGCEEFAFCADPLDDGRVILVERWASREALDRHLAASRSRHNTSSLPDPITPPNIVFYEVAAEEPYEPNQR
jgi:quinol monooxygenase YgiN